MDFCRILQGHRCSDRRARANFFFFLHCQSSVLGKTERVSGLKTYKLFIDGKFVRSGRRVVIGNDETNYSRASEDFHDAVTAARGVRGLVERRVCGGQILYRRRAGRREAGLQPEIERREGAKARSGSRAIDRLVYYAGWTDKSVRSLAR
jgi:hypothetical protein